MSREAMKLALEALEDYVEEYGPHEKDSGAAYVITALRQALETEQEPVAFINVEEQKLEWAKRTLWHTPTVVKLPKIPLYTAPPKREWVGLTDEEIDILSCETVKGNKSVNWLCKVLEAKLKENNCGH
jgi:hypothetical protein